MKLRYVFPTHIGVGVCAERVRAYGPGILFSLVIAAAATFIAISPGGPPILYALLIGMTFAFLAEDTRFAPGIGFASRGVLRIGVALLGARITIEQVLTVGVWTMAGIVGAVSLTITFGFLAAWTLGLPRRLGILSAGATAICGASAAAAISAVLPRYPNLERDTAFTIIGVTTLSTGAMVLYPMIARVLGFDDTEIGVFLGATIHDVAQVVGAGYSVSTEAGDTATIVKLFRVALLVPTVLAISLAGRGYADAGPSVGQPLLPSFLVVFVALVMANSVGLVPAQAGKVVASASNWCIISAIAALGVKTSLAKLAQVGRRAIGLMLAETVCIAAIVLTILITAG